jgi:hypothetical protein
MLLYIKIWNKLEYDYIKENLFNKIIQIDEFKLFCLNSSDTYKTLAINLEKNNGPSTIMVELKTRGVNNFRIRNVIKNIFKLTQFEVMPLANKILLDTNHQVPIMAYTEHVYSRFFKLYYILYRYDRLKLISYRNFRKYKKEWI